MGRYIQREPIELDGVRYSPAPVRLGVSHCMGCSFRVADWRDVADRCFQVQALSKAPCASDAHTPRRVIWLTDVDYAVHRLTEGAQA